VGATREAFFVTCAPGVEGVLHEEIRGLKLAKVERQVGGVYFEGTLEDAWRANLWLRTAVRVLMRVGRFQATDADALYRGVQEVDWTRFLAPEGRLIVSAHSKESALDHTLFIEQRSKDAIVDPFRARGGPRPSVDKEDPDLGVHVHLVRDRCTVLVDTSGESLHKRGWRRFQGRAPLAETLAAAVVLLSRWDRRAPLLDPFCGSGTLLVEAALLAGNLAPGSFRKRFGFERWPGHDAAGWARLRELAAARAVGTPKLVVRGSDSDSAMLTGARENLESAGLTERVELELADARQFRPRRGWNAWIVTNPPYGERVGDERALEQLYGTFGENLREHCAGSHLALLCGSPTLVAALGLPRAERLRLLNGPIECELVRAEL
jgi:23S rRNA (guanine2445-N2)-methyltransferase